jgi:hypothetical protein
VFQVPGKRTTGTKAQTYAITKLEFAPALKTPAYRFHRHLESSISDCTRPGRPEHVCRRQRLSLRRSVPTNIRLMSDFA